MPNVDDERNAHPVPMGQTEAAAVLATPARAAVCNILALIDAETRAHRNVGYKNSVSKFHLLKMSKCNELCNSLINGTYRLSAGEKHEIFEPKYRVVTSTFYKDRIPQSSYITNYFYPVVVPHLADCNYACLKDRGVDKARNALKDILRRAKMTDWILKADMKSYFASIDRQKLYGELGEFITDPWAMDFFRLVVENASGDRGLDLGSEVYQLSAGAFLTKLDRILSALQTFVRYQDDLLFIGTKDECRKTLEIIRSETERLGLRLSERKTFLQPIKRPIKFLGFGFLRHENGRVTMKRNPDRIRKERRRLRKMKANDIPAERIAVHYQSVRATLKKGSRSDLMKMDKYINELFKGAVTS